MRSFFAALLFIVAAAVTVVSCGDPELIGQISRGPRVLAQIKLGEDTRLKVPKGKVFRITVWTDPSFRYELEETTKPALLQCKKKSVPTHFRAAATKSNDGKLKQLFVCKAVKVGEAALQLVYQPLDPRVRIMSRVQKIFATVIPIDKATRNSATPKA